MTNCPKHDGSAEAHGYGGGTDGLQALRNPETLRSFRRLVEKLRGAVEYRRRVATMKGQT
ncbi:MAG: hypothetical protein BMS9Abin17_0658 [Acidimicrobiia bacterium]|nr:MAG: hypothetical protein BMS9Abin17_0658 [Acidimicrobiia bacterium]